ncbi:S26 family signal peptidase [Planctomycetota bacterium]
MPKLNMKKIFGYAKFGIGLILILVIYKKVLLIHGTAVLDPNDVSMEPTLYPRDRFFYRKTERLAAQMKKRDLVIFRPPDKPQEWRVARIKGVPGETVDGRRIPRGFLYLASDNPRKRLVNMVHEHFIIGRVHGVKILPRDEGKI